jgi:snapalysin
MKRLFAAGAAGIAMLALPLVAGQASAAPAAPAAAPHVQVATVYFDASGAPSFRGAILAGVSHWNSSVSNVQFVESPGNASLYYTEGNDPSGSYAQTDGHGSGTIFIDYTQASEYDQVRITAHESGHVLGLPDDYSGPCSELMSGGGPGTSCTNSYPDSTEVSEVNSMWANGLASGGHAMQRIYEPAMSH